MWSKKWSNLKQKIIRYISSGLCPSQIALTLALAFIIGIFPLYGITTFLMLFVANRLRLNAVIFVSTGYLFTPLLFIFWIPFIKFGHWLVYGYTAGFSLMEMENAISVRGSNLVFEFAEHLILGVLGWAVISPLILGILYFPLLFLLKKLKLNNRFSQPDGSQTEIC